MSILKKNYVSKLARVKKGRNLYARCFVTQDGIRKEIYLGTWGTEETELAYRRLCAEIYDDMPTVVAVNQITLQELFDKYLEYAESRLKKPGMRIAKKIIGVVIQFYNELPVNEFTAMPYRAIQERLTRIAPNPPSGREWSRQYVNRLMKTLRAILKWGISFDLVPSEVLAKIQSVPPVKEGEYSWLKDREDREDVPDGVVLRTLAFLPPTIADMVRIQRGASMRPCEVCSLKVGDLQPDGDLFCVGTKKHKTASAGVKRFFAFNHAETEILRRRCAGKSPDDHVFSPREAMQERWDAAGKSRKTPVQPSQRLRAESRETSRLLRYGTFYTADAYGQAIKYAVIAANRAGTEVEHWTPYQLRHAAVTDNSLRYGREEAGLIAGHKSISTTQIYDHKAQRISRKAAEERETWWENAAF